MVKVTGQERFDAFCLTFSALAGENLAKAVDKSADEFVAAAKQTLPINDLDPNPGDLRKSVHKVDGDGPLHKFVVADAMDAKGKHYGIHVEAGHRGPEGSGHVAAKPAWWPTYRLLKKRIKSRLKRAVRAAAKLSVSNGD